jgi:hypothetical protein
VPDTLSAQLFSSAMVSFLLIAVLVILAEQRRRTVYDGNDRAA